MKLIHTFEHFIKEYNHKSSFVIWCYEIIQFIKDIVHVQSFKNHKIRTRSESVSLPGTQFLFIDMPCSDSQNTSLLMFINQYF